LYSIEIFRLVSGYASGIGGSCDSHLLYIYIFIVCLYIHLCLCIPSITLTEVFPCFFLSCKANARVTNLKDGARPALFLRNFCVILCIVYLRRSVYRLCVNVYWLLPPGGYPTAVNKNIYHIISYHIIITRTSLMIYRMKYLTLLSARTRDFLRFIRVRQLKF
jgi:hypothetical protein